MKKRILSLVLCIVMMLTVQPINLPVWAATDDIFGGISDPIVEGSAAIDILINAGTNSEVLAGDLQDKIYEKLKVMLEAEGLDINVRINTPSFDLDTSDLSDWYVYEHSDTGYYSGSKNFEPNQDWKNDFNSNGTKLDKRPYFFHTQAIGSNIPKTLLSEWIKNPLTLYDSNGTASLGTFDRHIINGVDKNGNPSIDFVGYFNSAYQDFVFYPCESSEEKLVTFDINTKEVNPHTLLSVGFLFNAGIDSSGNINGYVLYYTYPGSGSDAIGTAPTNLILYKINDGVSAEAFHEFKKAATSVGDTKSYSNILTKVTEVSIGDSNWGDNLSISLIIKPTSITVYQTNDGTVPTKNTVPILKKDDLSKLIDVNGKPYNGFGPAIGYLPHGCIRATRFTYSNIRMAYINQTDEIFKLLSSANYIQNADLYFIDLTDDGENRKLNQDGTKAAAYMQAKKIRYITNNLLDELLDEGPLGNNGLNTGNTNNNNIDALANQIAEYIISQYGTPQPNYGENQLPLSDPVALLSLVRDTDPDKVKSTYIDTVRRDLIGDKGEIFGYDTESKPSADANAITNYKYIITYPDGKTVTQNHTQANKSLFTITNEKDEDGKYIWPVGEYTVQLEVTDDSTPTKTSAPVTVTFKVVADTVAPLVPTAIINDGKLSFTTSDKDGYGVVGYELICTPIGEGFEYDGENYSADNGEEVFPISTTDITIGSQTEAQTIGNITLPVGEYTMKLAVYDMAGNKTIVNIPVIDYIDEKLIGIKDGTTVDVGSTADNTGKVTISEAWMNANKSYQTSNDMKDKAGDSIEGENKTQITITIPSRPDEPNVKGINEYSDGQKTYKIKDVRDTMEYKSLQDSNYTAITGNEVELESYNENKPYSIRYKAIQGKQFSGKVKTVSFTEDTISPVVPTVSIEDGELSFTIKDIGGYGVYSYELTYEPLGSGFKIGDTTYVETKTFKPEVTEAITLGSITEEQTISGILLPLGEYTMTLTVYDGAGNKTIVMIPTINYVEEKLLNIKPNTTVGGSTVQEEKTVSIKDNWFGTSLTYDIKNNVCDYEDTPYQNTNETQITVNIPARPSAPTSVKGGISYNGKYKIKGITDAMEFKSIDDDDYTNVDETVDEFIPVGISGEGTYLARFKAVPGYKFASENKSFSFETHTISGKVYDYDKTTLKVGATVELYVGNKPIGTTTTDSNGEFFFDNVEDGNYNIVVKYEQLGTTIMVSVTGENTNTIVYLPDGKKNITLDIKDDIITPQEIVVDNLDKLFEATPNVDKGEDVIISEADKDIIKDGGKLEIIFNAKGFEEDTEEFAQPVSKLKELASEDGRIIGLYIDLTVTKYLWEGLRPAYEYNEANDVTALKHLPELIQTIIPLDKIEGLTNNVNLKVYRCHKDTSDTIISEPIPEGFSNRNEYGEYFEINNNSVILTVRRFSEYAIAYEDTNPGDVKVTINKDGIKWGYAGDITLVISGTTHVSIENGVSKLVDGGTYKICRNGIDTGKTVTVKASPNLSDITINYYTLTLEHDKGFSGATGDGIYIEGTSVSIDANLFNSYAFDKWISEPDTFGDLDTKKTSFAMPGNPLTLTATSKYNSSGNVGGGIIDVGNVIVNPTSNGTVTYNTSNPVVGSKVTITVNPNAGYTLHQLTIKDKDGNIITFTNNGDGTYTFIQPEGVATISTDFKIDEKEQDVTEPKDQEPSTDNKDKNKDKDKEPDIPTVYMKKLMGQNQKFMLTLLNQDGAKVTCQSTKPKLAKVNKNGLVTTNTRLGKCEIIVTIEKGKNKIRYIMAVTVKDDVLKNYSFTKDYEVDYKKPTIGAYKLLEKGRNWNIQIINTNETTKISYTSSDKSIATVNKKGKVTTKKLGRADITAKVTQNGITNKFFFTIRVTDGNKVSDKSYLRVVK